jgi:hypothetical protein
VREEGSLPLLWHCDLMVILNGSCKITQDLEVLEIGKVEGVSEGIEPPNNV